MTTLQATSDWYLGRENGKFSRDLREDGGREAVVATDGSTPTSNAALSAGVDC